jgi:hypothetical protein
MLDFQYGHRETEIPDDRIPVVQSNRADIDAFFAKARAVAKALAELLRAAAAYAVGGRQALLSNQSAGAVMLLRQLK